MAIHNKSRCAVPALKSKVFHKSLLDRGISSPSMVVTFFPSLQQQALNMISSASPSTLTVHAPQSPFKQPGFAPVRPKLILDAYKSVSADRTVTDRFHHLCLS